MDRYTKTILTGILLVLISIAAKDVDLFPIAEAQQGWEIENDLAMMDGSMQALPASNGLAYICHSIFVPRSSYKGVHGYLRVVFHAEPQCMGSYVGSGYMFSEGATHWDALSSYLLNENQLLTFYELASRAADTGQRVAYGRCADEKTLCLRYISFRGDPADVAD